MYFSNVFPTLSKSIPPKNEGAIVEMAVSWAMLTDPVPSSAGITNIPTMMVKRNNVDHSLLIGEELEERIQRESSSSKWYSSLTFFVWEGSKFK